MWVGRPPAEWLVGVEHESQDAHEIQRHALTATPTGVAASPAELMLDVDHVDQMRFEPVPGGGYVLGYTEFVLGSAGTLQVTPALVGQGVEPLGPLAGGNPALARAGGGSLAMIAWVDDSAGQQIRYGRLAGDGTLPRMSVALGQLDSTLGHYHTLQRVGQSVVALWTDTTMSRTFSATRVCF